MVARHLGLIDSFSSDYKNDYEYEIRHFRTKLGAVCLRHLDKLVVEIRQFRRMTNLVIVPVVTDKACY